MQLFRLEEQILKDYSERLKHVWAQRKFNFSRQRSLLRTVRLGLFINNNANLISSVICINNLYTYKHYPGKITFTVNMKYKVLQLKYPFRFE